MDRDSGSKRPPDTLPADAVASVDRRVKRFHHSAGAIVLVDGKALLLQRRDRDEWVLPKGHLEPGETPEEAARREVAEETGLEVRLLAPVGVTEYDFRRGRTLHHKWVDWFLAEAVTGEIHLEPFFSAYRLEDETAATHRISHAEDRDMLERAFAAAREVRP